MTAGRAAPLAFAQLPLLPAALKEPARPLRAILVGWLTSLAGSLLLGVAVRLLAPEVETPQFPDASPVLLLFLLVVFAPIAETLIMAAALELLLRLRVPPVVAIAVSTAGWAAAHSLEAAAWGLVIWWPFLVFSTLYVTWRERSSSAGFSVAAATHALQNLIPALLLAYAATR